MYGETFYGRHTAQHQLQWRQIELRNENWDKHFKQNRVFRINNCKIENTNLFCYTEFILTPHGPLLREIYPSYPHSGLSKNLLSMFIISKIISMTYTLLQLFMTYAMSLEMSMQKIVGGVK